MDESRKQILISAGIDADDALERLMGNESLLERLRKAEIGGFRRGTGRRAYSFPYIEGRVRQFIHLRAS